MELSTMLSASTCRTIAIGLFVLAGVLLMVAAALFFLLRIPEVVAALKGRNVEKRAGKASVPKMPSGRASKAPARVPVVPAAAPASGGTLPLSQVDAGGTLPLSRVEPIKGTVTLEQYDSVEAALPPDRTRTMEFEDSTTAPMGTVPLRDMLTAVKEAKTKINFRPGERILVCGTRERI